ncbi:hypothetical protein [uncultured Phascolarctobacterium sp.]|jgi:hypothetical protein|uniref:hypothetical protein n=1 Tax=uncultured Phascolarctobacterium sp. TaxID=512296 RepID=UPI0025D5FDAE|nr:hypothetical protein [uncultured Phascolarctobacterium sp.]
MIAIIYEGEKAEPKIWESIKLLKITDDIIDVNLEAALCDNIYSLYTSLHEDGFIDIVSWVQEKIRKSPNSRLESKFQRFLEADREQFSEVYLFFDLDLHHSFHDNIKEEYDNNLNRLEEMICFFNNETENGKLYISYPMVEALKDLAASNVCNNRCCIHCNESGSYKRSINDNAKDFQDVRKYNCFTWAHFCRHAIMKANCIVNGTYNMTDYATFIGNISQWDIFKKQELEVKNHNRIYVLSAFPLFLLEYFGEKSWDDSGLLKLENKELMLKLCDECKLQN